jgi:VWFA-related protein
MASEHSLSRRSLFSALGIIPAIGLLRGQQQQSAPPLPNQDVNQERDPAKFSSGVKVVNLFANVRNKKGEIVRDLTKNDFLLEEDGRPQTIGYFSQETNLPLTLGLLVDTSGSQRRLISEERDASYRFFGQVLRPDKDLAFLIHFDFEVELLQDITSNRKSLEKGLEDLQAPQQNRQNRGGYPGGGYPGGGGGQGRSGGGTLLYDAILLASDEIMKRQSGRKAIILLTDGVDNGSKVSLYAAVEASQRADTLVYSILFEDPDAYGSPIRPQMGGRGRSRGGMGGGMPPMGGGNVSHANGKKVLEQISRETGGRFFQVSKKNPLDKVYADIEDDLRHQYSIGYTPDRSDAERNYHKIHLTTKEKSLTVQTREGYYST